jgi:hypothetical protein
MENLQKYLDKAWTLIVDYSPKLITALILLVVGYGFKIDY